MSREIKFRVWDKSDQCYREIVAMTWSGKYLYLGPGEGMLVPDDPGNMCGGQGFKMTDSADRDRLIIEQYTGLKDKNGKEIYEGDIIRVENGKIGHVGEMLEGGFSFWVGDCWHRICSICDSLLPADRVCGEVIGNIHFWSSYCIGVSHGCC